MKQIMFPGNESFWYETLRSFDHVAYGGADFAEVLVISDRITAGDYDSWHDAYLAAADRIAAEADDALAAGHRISARDGPHWRSDLLRRGSGRCRAAVGHDADPGADGGGSDRDGHRCRAAGRAALPFQRARLLRSR